MIKNKNKTLVIGASENPSRYSFMAANRLLSINQEIVLLGKRKGQIQGVEIQTECPLSDDIDTVTLYINKEHQKAYYSYIISLKPRRVIFNPGTENEEFVQLLATNNIFSEIACTLVLIASGQY